MSLFDEVFHFGIQKAERTITHEESDDRSTEVHLNSVHADSDVLRNPDISSFEAISNANATCDVFEETSDLGEIISEEVISEVLRTVDDGKEQEDEIPEQCDDPTHDKDYEPVLGESV